MGEIKVDSAARAESDNLVSLSQDYLEYSNTLRTIRNELSSSWEGDTTDIDSILTNLDNSTAYLDEKLSPALNKLGVSVGALLDATDKSSANTVDSYSNVSTDESNANSNSGQPEKYYQKANRVAGEHFSEDWENYKDSFSGYYANTADSHGVITGAGNAILDTIGAGVGTLWNTTTFAANSVCDGVQWATDMLLGDSGLGALCDWLI